MLIVAIAWIYVVGLMALTEPSIVAGIVTFLFYCVLPLSTLLYIAGSGRRKARRRAEEAAAREARLAPADAADAADAINAINAIDAAGTPDAADAAGTVKPAAPGHAARGED